MDKKKMLLVVGFIIVVLILGLALYWIFFRQAPPVVEPVNYNGGNIPNIPSGNANVVTNVNINENTGLPWENYLQNQVAEVANSGLTKVTGLTDSAVVGLGLGPNGLQYYDSVKKQFFNINSQGQIDLLNAKKFYGVQTVNWSTQGDKAILEYPDGTNILYNFKTDQQVTLPAELQDFSFDRNGSQIAAEWINKDGNTDNNWLVTANEDGSGLSLIEPLGTEEADVQVGISPDNQVAALYRKYIDVQNQEVFPIGFNGENISSFTVQGAGFTSRWSPRGDSLLYSVYNQATDYLPNLWITGGQTGQLGNLKVSLDLATWPDKCTFSVSNELYCAVPKGLPRGAGLYPEMANDYSDVFYKVDLNSGQKTLLANPVGSNLNYTVHNLFLSTDESILYFTDQNGILQSLRLK
jgi:hypothetical protein